MPCPDPIPGALADLSGSVAGRSATELVDATALKDPVAYQWQHYAVCSSTAGICGRWRANQVKAGELWLMPILIGSRDPMDFELCPPPVTPITLDPTTNGIRVPDDPANPAGPGNLYMARVNWRPYGSRCSSYADTHPTAGSVTFTTATADLLEGSFDLTFGTDHVSGSWSAPTCVLCVSRPSKCSTA